MAAGYGHEVHDAGLAELILQRLRIRAVDRHRTGLAADIILAKHTHRQSRHQHTPLIGQLFGHGEKRLLHMRDRGEMPRRSPHLRYRLFSFQEQP